MGDLVLETARLVLRKFDEGDAENIARRLNSKAVMDHLGGPKELFQIEEKIAKTLAGYARDGFGFMAMIEKDTGEMVGQCGMKRVDNALAKNQGDHEIGWLVREDRWRRGYAYEAMCAVMEWAFTRHDAPHIVALTSPRNEASWRMMEKLGMKRRADLDFDDPAYGDDAHTIQYSISRQQWEKAQ